MIGQLALGSARRTTFELPGHRIAALQSGRPTDPPALLVPGYTGSKEDFAPILDPLADAGYFATAIDLPGQYESQGLPDAADYTPDRLAESVLTVAAALGPRVRLLGHSFGGLVARAAVIAEATRFDSLVLLASGPASVGGARRAAIDQLAPVLAASGLPGVYAAMRAAELGEPGFVAPPAELGDFLARRFLAGSPEMLRGMGDALRNEPDRVAELKRTGVDVLVAHGVDDDAWTPETQREMAQRLQARHVVIADAAHSPAVENPPAMVSALVHFWREAP